MSKRTVYCSIYCLVINRLFFPCYKKNILAIKPYKDSFLNDPLFDYISVIKNGQPGKRLEPFHVAWSTIYYNSWPFLVTTWTGQFWKLLNTLCKHLEYFFIHWLFIFIGTVSVEIILNVFQFVLFGLLQLYKIIKMLCVSLLYGSNLDWTTYVLLYLNLMTQLQGFTI